MANRTPITWEYPLGRPIHRIMVDDAPPLNPKVPYGACVITVSLICESPLLASQMAVRIRHLAEAENEVKTDG